MIGKVVMTMRSRKINIEAMPTEDAIGAYNYLVEEDRLVAAALIPPEEVKFSNETNHVDNLLLQRGTEFGDKYGSTGLGFDHAEHQELISEIKDFKEFAKDPGAYRNDPQNIKDLKDDLK